MTFSLRGQQFAKVWNIARSCWQVAVKRRMALPSKVADYGLLSTACPQQDSGKLQITAGYWLTTVQTDSDLMFDQELNAEQDIWQQLRWIAIEK